jgi:hypothetical protein
VAPHTVPSHGQLEWNDILSLILPGRDDSELLLLSDEAQKQGDLVCLLEGHRVGQPLVHRWLLLGECKRQSHRMQHHTSVQLCCPHGLDQPGKGQVFLLPHTVVSQYLWDIGSRTP